MTLRKTTLSLFAAIAILAGGVFQAQAAAELRTWVDQTGRTVKARLTDVQGTDVVIQLENNTSATVPLSRFSAADQAYVTEWAKAANKAAPSLAALPLKWPDSVTVDAKSLQITPGEQDAAARRYVYRSGSFQFTSNAPLTGTLMHDIAGDFELVKTLFDKLPWGWQPKPSKGGAFFEAVLTETDSDYIAAGGDDNSSGFSKGGIIYSKFSGLGLKKVGARYARDAKSDSDGEMIGLIARLVMGDMSRVVMPWSAMGIEKFLKGAAYRNGSFQLAKPERGLKDLIAEESARAPIDLNLMMALLRQTWAENRGKEVVEIRIQNYFFGALLVYYFGYLEGDGSGARLHRYFQAMAQEALAWRNYQEARSAGKKGLTAPPSVKSSATIAVELNEKYIICGRSDDEIRADIVAKFKSIGIKL